MKFSYTIEWKRWGSGNMRFCVYDCDTEEEAIRECISGAERQEI